MKLVLVFNDLAMHACLHLSNISRSHFLLKYCKSLEGETTQNGDYPKKKMDRLLKSLDSHSSWFLNLASCIINNI